MSAPTWQDGTSSVAPYGRAGTVDLAEKVAEVMKEYDCCLMESHGAIAADKDHGRGILKGPVRGGNRGDVLYHSGRPETGQNHMPCRWRKLQKWLIQKKSFFRRI